MACTGPPEVRGRTGYYGPEHLARLQLVRELQADGFNLELIRRLLESAGSSTAALRFTRASARISSPAPARWGLRSTAGTSSPA